MENALNHKLAEGVCTSQLNTIIPRLPQNPKFVVIDDPEIVGDLIAEGFPFVG